MMKKKLVTLLLVVAVGCLGIFIIIAHQSGIRAKENSITVTQFRNYGERKANSNHVQMDGPDVDTYEIGIRRHYNFRDIMTAISLAVTVVLVLFFWIRNTIQNRKNRVRGWRE